MAGFRRKAFPWLAAAGALWAAGCAGRPAGEKAAAPSVPPAKVPYAVLVTTKGTITAKLFSEAAPKAVDNFIALASGKKEWRDPKTGKSTNRPLYNGTIFHRVIPGFMIQGGDPLGDGTGGPGYAFEDETSAYVFDRPGLLAMANSGPNTNGSQFFITVAPAPWLNGHHTIFGEVVEGQAVADAIAHVPRTNDGYDRPLEPVVLREVRIEYR